MKITFIVGLPGSGKSYYGNSLVDENVIYLDDISIHGDPLLAIQNAMGFEHILISDVFLCLEKERERAIKTVKRITTKAGFKYDVNWIFFENNPEQCLKNIAYRSLNGDNRLVKGLIHELTKEYTIPQWINPIKIWDGT